MVAGGWNLRLLVAERLGSVLLTGMEVGS